ncbi:aldehyde dehydrogenase family protein [Aliagarivorans marinus]|uniref:aldehyde dehydrogenase family protein n=1 Tax=Aliagarivorans marinus TaxID=561965 RepID=UPI00047C4F07|nr:aldehyde dehydrogenase family protein [Aliagarivorans marinus]
MISSRMYIDGRSVESSSKFDVINPATDEKVAVISIADRAIANEALNAAKAAERSWSTLPVDERVEWMHKLRGAFIENEERLRMAVHIETGKSWASTGEDFQKLVDSLSFYAEEIKRFTPPQIEGTAATHKHTLKYRPVGVVVAYLSWNFPLLNLGFKLGPAMASGCPVVLKPSLKAPLSAYLVGEICEQVGLPAGCVNVIAGSDNEIGNFLSASTIPSLLTLIGSINTGVKVMQAGASSIKRYSMELGGNTPFIVYNDADIDKAVATLISLKYGNSGQVCVAPNRVFVQSQIKPAFVEALVSATRAVTMGFDRDADIVMGPVIDKQSRTRIHALVADAVNKGATVLAGGSFDGDAKGAFYPPTIVSGVNSTMTIYHEEIFGPVISLIMFDDEQSVIEQANNTDTGLASYVFTQDKAKAQRVSEQLEFGEVQINGVSYSIELPHVGIKQSGIGCDCSKFALDDYLYLTRVSEAI